MQFETKRDAPRQIEEPSLEEFRGTHRLAWAALTISLALFVAGVIFIPRGVGALLGGVVESRPVRAEILEGTVLYQPPATAVWQDMPADASLTEGSRIRTDERSRVFLTLPDGSTALLYNETELGVQRMQFGRFNTAVQDTVLRLYGGRLNLGVSRHPETPDRTLELLARDARVDLAEGSFRIDLADDGAADLSVRAGRAILMSGAHSATVGAGQRARVLENAAIQAPLPLDRGLVADPFFATDLDGSVWQSFIDTEAGVAGRVIHSEDELRFVRRTDDGSTQRHGESGVLQTLDRDVRDFVRLGLRVDVRADHQSLSGGGTAGTEYPLIIRLTYLDADGQEQVWGRGFYYQNDEGLSVKLGQKIPAGEWVTYQSDDLLHQLQPTPVSLRRIEVLGSGWEYESAIRGIELTGH